MLLTDSFCMSVEKGVNQDDPVLPMLITVPFEMVFRKVNWGLEAVLMADG